MVILFYSKGFVNYYTIIVVNYYFSKKFIFNHISLINPLKI
jgi:hypothetical protein